MTRRAPVVLQVWRVRRRDAVRAMVGVQLAAGRLRRRGDVGFVKALGTSTTAFLPTAATPTRWALLTCGRDGTAAGVDRGPWDDTAVTERATLTLRVLSSRGTWDRRAPFDADADADADADTDLAGWDGPVVVLTRATLRARRAARFYAAVPAVAAELRRAHGCRAAFGIGESPVLRQGTVSVWDSADAMRAFAHRSPAHVAAVTATPRERWYAEELFTRFALVGASGSIDGSRLR